MSKIVIVSCVLLFDLLTTTVWHNWFDSQMLYLEEKFVAGDYGQGLEWNYVAEVSDGINFIYSGGIFAKRDEYLRSRSIIHSCRWTVHHNSGEEHPHNNTMCLFFWLPFFGGTITQVYTVNNTQA